MPHGTPDSWAALDDRQGVLLAAAGDWWQLVQITDQPPIDAWTGAPRPTATLAQAIGEAWPD